MGNKIGVSRVREALQEVVAENPQRVDRRTVDGLAPCYVEHGAPNCLGAAVMHRLGISLGVLKQLDREAHGSGGIVLWASQHRIRHRFTPAAWELLSAIQTSNDLGRMWDSINKKVFTANEWIGRRWEPNGPVGRPWLIKE